MRRRADWCRPRDVARRTIAHRYADPLDEVWTGAARRLGFTLRSGDTADRIAQAIFRQLCHALVVEHRHRDAKPDSAVLKQACDRLQAALADRHGLREFIASDDARLAALPTHPLRGGGQPAAWASEAMVAATEGPWSTTLDEALRATAGICGLTRPWVDERSTHALSRPLHASGFPEHVDPAARCGDCAWLYRAGPGPRVHRCRQSRQPGDGSARRVQPDDRACQRHEPMLDNGSCRGCGACCREGFHLVPVSPRERILRVHPELVTLDAHGAHLGRPGGSCVALSGDGAKDPYTCTVYGVRPRACRDFEVAGDACLEARRRVGLSY